MCSVRKPVPSACSALPNVMHATHWMSIVGAGHPWFLCRALCIAHATGRPRRVSGHRARTYSGRAYEASGSEGVHAPSRRRGDVERDVEVGRGAHGDCRVHRRVLGPVRCDQSCVRGTRRDQDGRQARATRRNSTRRSALMVGASLFPPSFQTSAFAQDGGEPTVRVDARHGRMDAARAGRIPSDLGGARPRRDDGGQPRDVRAAAPT